MCQLAFRFWYLIDEHEKKILVLKEVCVLREVNKQLQFREIREWDVGVDGETEEEYSKLKGQWDFTKKELLPRPQA